MLTSIEIIKDTMSAATNAVKPTAVWGSTLKLAVATHPVAFLAITGGTLVSLGTYYYTANKLDKNRQKKEKEKEKEQTRPGIEISEAV